MKISEQNKQILEQMTRQMAEAQTADDLMAIWADNVTWYDTVNLTLKGEDARHHYREQFQYLGALTVDFLELESCADDNIGFVHSVQHFKAEGKNGAPDVDFIFRQTDCFVKQDGEWKVQHQHVSLPVDMAQNSIQWHGKYPY